MRALATVVVLAALTAPVRADLTVGSFAPSAALPTTAARVDVTARLAAHLGAALGQPGVGRVYAKAWDFARAVKAGEVRVGLVDPVYAASVGGRPTVLAVGTDGGGASQGWQLVARGATDLMALRGQALLVPDVGGREGSFVADVLFAGDLPRGHFASIDAAPDTASALAALGLGKAAAAVVPVGATLPAGVRVVLSLPSTPGPLLIAYGPLTPTERATLIGAATSFVGGPGLTGFVAAGGDEASALARRFTPATKRGPLAAPPSRLPLGALVAGRTLAVGRATLAALAPPVALPPPPP